MVLPESMRQSLAPEEIQFICENEAISILPRYSMPKVNLIAGGLSSLKGMRKIDVPLWVALILKGQGKCNIIVPEWLNSEHLSEAYEQEKKYPHVFSKLPWNWLEKAKILLNKAADDFPDSGTHIRSLVQDLREIRQQKSRRGLRELNESNIQLNGSSLMEINEVRPFVLGVMGRLGQLHESVTSDIEDEDDDDSELE